MLRLLRISWSTRTVVAGLSPRLFFFSPDAVSFGYVCGDTADKAYKEYSEGKGLAAAGKMGFDVLLWQSLASVAVPGLTINLAVSISPLLFTLLRGYLCTQLFLCFPLWDLMGVKVWKTRKAWRLQR